MKQFALFLLLTITASCAVTPQQKAEKAVKEYMMNALDNPKAYEPVSSENQNIYQFIIPIGQRINSVL